MGPIGCPETSARNYHNSMCNIPENGISDLLRGGSLRSHKILSAYLPVLEEEENEGGGGREKWETLLYFGWGEKEQHLLSRFSGASPARPSGGRSMEMNIYEGHYKGDRNTLKQGLWNFNFSLMPKGITGKLNLVIFCFKARKLILLKLNGEGWMRSMQCYCRESWKLAWRKGQTKETCVDMANRRAFRMPTNF